ncbi:hypothetical protein SAMN05216317_1571 [Nitrosomonas eutropha]|nr:hypothetical protein SAMN05216317_1571 [Nitrosomonas eutropha]
MHAIDYSLLQLMGKVMHAYSQDLRDRILGALDRGEGPTAIARRFEVSRMWVYRYASDGKKASAIVCRWEVIGDPALRTRKRRFGNG